MDLSLSGKVVLVTGSSRGIGRATAEAFLREGTSVCLCARGEGDLETTRAELAAACGDSHHVTAVAVDVTHADEAQRAVEHTLQSFGRLDILVNNVGGSRGTGAFHTVAEESFNEVMDLNFTSAVLCSREAVSWMKAHGGGVILNVGSINGREYATSSPYTAAKAALTALTKEMAVDLAPFNIRVNSVAPGSVHFPGGSWDRRMKAEPEKIARMLETELPFKRFGKAVEIAEVIVFACSPRASWLSGACIPVDGAQGRAF